MIEPTPGQPLPPGAKPSQLRNWLNHLLKTAQEGRAIPDPSSGLVGQRTPQGTVIGLAGVAGGGRLQVARTGTSGIPARSGTTAGSANVTLHKMNPSTGALTATTAVVKCFNLSSVAIGASKYIDILPTTDGAWRVVVESCA